MTEEMLKQLAGEQAVEGLMERMELEIAIVELQRKNDLLLQQRRKVLSTELENRDIIFAAVAGAVCGTLGGCFKSYVPKTGKWKHKHSVRRVAIDYKIPNLEGRKGSVQGLHRQIGPGHDIGRLREALDLISGKTKDFPLWGKSITEQTGGVLHAGNMRVDEFIQSGGFRIPADPKKELLNHWIIDFFTKTSLPLPFSSYIADYNELLGRMMLDMYEKGLNLKNAVGNSTAFQALQTIIRGYVYLGKVLPKIGFYEKIGQVKSVEELTELIDRAREEYKAYLHSKEFYKLQMVAQGVDCILDTVRIKSSVNYTGIFAWNWCALLSCGVNAVKYLSCGKKEYKELTEELEENQAVITEKNRAWSAAFRTEAERLAEAEY